MHRTCSGLHQVFCTYISVSSLVLFWGDSWICKQIGFWFLCLTRGSFNFLLTCLVLLQNNVFLLYHIICFLIIFYRLNFWKVKFEYRNIGRRLWKNESGGLLSNAKYEGCLTNQKPEQRQVSPEVCGEKMDSLSSWFLTFSFHKYERINFCCFKLSSLW